MVYRGHIDAQTKAYVRCLRLQSDLTVREIVHLCGISRTSESFQEFAQRVKSTLYSVRREIIDNTIGSMYKRLDLVLNSRGGRTKY